MTVTLDDSWGHIWLRPVLDWFWSTNNRETMMSEEQRQALEQLIKQDEGFHSAMMRATSIEEAVRIAGEHGIAATAEDFRSPDDRELSETELELASGGILDQIWPTTPWVAC